MLCLHSPPAKSPIPRLHCRLHSSPMSSPIFCRCLHFPLKSPADMSPLTSPFPRRLFSSVVSTPVPLSLQFSLHSPAVMLPESSPIHCLHCHFQSPATTTCHHFLDAKSPVSSLFPLIRYIPKRFDSQQI